MVLQSVEHRLTTASDVLVGSVSSIVGNDNRRDITSADSAAITLYTPTSGTELLLVAIRVAGYSGTVTAGTYTLGWTENTVAMTNTATISAVGDNSNNTMLIQPDNAKAVTGQLSTLTGTSPAVDVGAIIIRVE